MLKTRICCAILLACLLCGCTALASVSATPNQKLAFRTGPNTKYVELYTLPQSTSLRAFEYEEGNGVTWVLVEYTDKNGYTCRAYTGLKRMSVNGSIPWASHLNQRVLVDWCTVWSAPSANAASRGELGVDDPVTLLAYEGDWAFIEFEDYYHNQPSRGYIKRTDIQGSRYQESSSGTTGSWQQYQNGVVNAPFEYNEAFFGRYGAFTPFDDGIYANTSFTEGWVVGDWLATAGIIQFRVAHCNEYVNARKEADASTDSLQRFYLGETVWGIGWWREWTLVVCNQGYGWVKSKYLDRVPERW